MICSRSPSRTMAWSAIVLKFKVEWKVFGGIYPESIFRCVDRDTWCSSHPTSKPQKPSIRAYFRLIQGFGEHGYRFVLLAPFGGSFQGGCQAGNKKRSPHVEYREDGRSESECESVRSASGHAIAMTCQNYQFRSGVRIQGLDGSVGRAALFVGLGSFLLVGGNRFVSKVPIGNHVSALATGLDFRTVSRR